MAALTVQSATEAGTVITYAAATTGPGDTFTADAHSALLVRNGSGASIDVTFASKATARPGLAVTNKTVAVGAGVDKLISADQGGFGDPTTGAVTVTYSAVTTVTVAALRI